MRIVVLPPRGVNFPDGSPWGNLLVGLREAGHDVDHFGARTGRVDAMVSMNDQPDARRLQSELGIPVRRSALVVLEPRVTAPRMYEKSALGHYGHRFAPSPLWAKLLAGEVFPWPQVLRVSMRGSGPWRYAATMINAEKRSAVRGSLYGLRRAVIRACDMQSVPLAVFGSGWDDSAPQRLKKGVEAVARALRAGDRPWLGEALGQLSLTPSHTLGVVAGKPSAFAVAPVAIVIENSRDYVSEKLFDALLAGVAPIYVGPPLSMFGIPSEVAVEVEPDAPAVVSALSDLSESRREEVALAGHEWLGSADSQRHEIHGVLKDLGHVIGDRLTSSGGT